MLETLGINWFCINLAQFAHLGSPLQHEDPYYSSNALAALESLQTTSALEVSLLPNVKVKNPKPGSGRQA